MDESTNGRPIATRSEFAKKGRRIHEFPVPSMGCTVNMRSLSGMERATFGAAFKKFEKAEIDDQTRNVLLPCLARSLVTPEGDRIYPDEAIEELGSLDAPILDEMIAELMAISGLKKDAVGEAEKNSETTPSADLPSV